MVYRTKFGEIEISDNDILDFDMGLPGFENLKKFAVISQGTEPIMWLVSLEDEKIALPVIDPWIVRVDYDVKIPKEAVEFLELESEEDVKIWSVLVVPKDSPENMTINLLAPIVVNKKTKKAMQVILETEEYDIRHSVREEIERSRKVLESLQEGALKEEEVVKQKGA
ncbi:MAG: flagellar assembly protein FliW [Thermotogaceae bacterium]|nr:flagellar assembly protein FliW [Thermotogaceae bacterium]